MFVVDPPWTAPVGGSRPRHGTSGYSKEATIRRQPHFSPLTCDVVTPFLGQIFGPASHCS